MNEEAIYAVLLMLGFQMKEDDDWMRYPGLHGGVQARSLNGNLGMVYVGGQMMDTLRAGKTIATSMTLDEFVSIWEVYHGDRR